MCERRNGCIVVLLALLVACAPAATPTPRPISSAPGEPQAGAMKVLGQTGITLVYVPAGEFTMGSTAAQIDQALKLCKRYHSRCERSEFLAESPAHSVALDGFWIGETEVTNAQYKQFIDAGGYSKREY